MQTEHEEEAVVFAPAHDLVAAEARIAPHDDPDTGPAGEELTDDPLELLDRMADWLLVGGVQRGANEKFAAEDVQRQVAVAVIEAVKETAFLLFNVRSPASA